MSGLNGRGNGVNGRGRYSLHSREMTPSAAKMLPSLEAPGQRRQMSPRSYAILKSNIDFEISPNGKSNFISKKQTRSSWLMACSFGVPYVFFTAILLPTYTPQASATPIKAPKYTSFQKCCTKYMRETPTASATAKNRSGHPRLGEIVNARKL